MDTLPRPDWCKERRIALAALLEIHDSEPGDVVTGSGSDVVTAEMVRIRILNHDWVTYHDHSEFVNEYKRLTQ